MLTRCKASRTGFAARNITLSPNIGRSLPIQTNTEEKQNFDADVKPTTSDSPWKSILRDVPPNPPILTGRTGARRLKENFFSSRNSHLKRGYATDASQRHDPSSSSSPSTSKLTGLSTKPGSLFDSPGSAWDKVFENLDDMPPLVSKHVRNPLRATSSSPDTHRRGRRQAMTAREISAFDDMFNMIFNAVNEQKFRKEGPGATRVDPLSSVGIGRGPEGSGSPMSDLFGKLRRHTKRFKWGIEADEVLDRKKEEMELCDTDLQLLEWAMRELFADSQNHEAEARRAVTGAQKPLAEIPMLQSPAYPHLLAQLMRTFREKYHDPHLALSVFDHARHLSIASYVFGCTTPAYNELIETRWTCFRDLRGVLDALEEMHANGVESDSRTVKLVEALRREVGERNLWQEEIDRNSGEVLEMLSRMDDLMAKKRPREQQRASTSSKVSKPKRWNASSEAWKFRGEMDEGKPNDDWEFGRWESTEHRRPRSKPRSRQRPPHRPMNESLEFL
ncbi:hypothetical protein BD410DRAFT_770199 [Rickenella mellea]|uniref:Mtf2-like C-terminal domain-containing protein n=1 Tax=Rickenella mellea TaxID=50990 RepID=A0A4Y7Q6X0_9AGAM|nr:hypothetical protein BD410DRAFT_770199 [Rickenella mellea]